MRPRSALACAVLLPAALAAQGARPATSALARRLDSAATAWLALRESPSVSVAVVRGRDTLLVKAFGVAHLEWHARATPATVYRTGSVTKQFTAALVLQLVDSGRVRLDDSVAAHLPGLAAAWRRVTVRQLLDHTSGIPSYTGSAAWRRRSGEAMVPDTLVSFVAADSMDFAPGSAWRYNNTGYVLLGMLVERVAGKPYATLLEERIFRLAGLAETRYCATEPVLEWRAAGYYHDAGTFYNAPWLSMTQPFSAGALCSTARDLVRWNQALHGGRVVGSASYRAMTTPTGVAAKGPPRYALGLIADSLAGRAMLTHGGQVHGFMAANAWFPAESLSVTVLANSMNSRPDALLRTLARIALTGSARESGSR